MKRLTGKEVTKHTVESFIKSGAFDCLEGTRKQKLLVYQSMLDHVNREKKDNTEGQISLFDMGNEELTEAVRITYPDVGEFDKEEYLNYEKEMLGIYVSGHPLEEYLALMEKNCTNTSRDFAQENEQEEMGMTRLQDGDTVIIGGMISGKTVKVTKNNTVMAFITVEDLYGTVEVIIFPRDYEKNKMLLEKDTKVFVKGRVTVEEERGGKLICQQLIPFDEVPCELWIRFQDIATFTDAEAELYEKIAPYDGKDSVCIYVKEEKQVKRLPRSRSVNARKIMEEQLLDYLGEGSVAIQEKSIEK